jgi:hypothetical protein
MKKLKGLKIVLLILLIAVSLVIVRSASKNRFKQDAGNTVEAISGNNFSISFSDYKTAENQYFVVDLTESGPARFKSSTKIEYNKLLDANTIQQLKQTDRIILLYSQNISDAAKAWVILNQLKFKNVFVLSEEKTPEVLKYEFNPGTSARL